MEPILIVEDDLDINNLLATILTQAEYPVEQAYSGTEAKLLVDVKKYSLLLLDLMLPGMTGEEVIQYLRQKNMTPVIILSAKDTKLDKVNLLRLGADDYLTKPFDNDELLARIEALFRRVGNTSVSPETRTLSYKNVELHKQTRQVTVAEKEVVLTSREFDILSLFMENPRKVFTKSNLYESVWNDEFFGDDNTINVHISNLRTKLGNKNMIKTVWGIGFKLDD